MNKVLMIAYDFPPIASVGVFRTLKFARYLPRFGWKPVILTVRNPDRYAVGKSDPYYAGDKLREVKIFRSYSIPLGWILKTGRLGINHKWFLIPDVFTGWLPFAFSLGKKIVAKEKIDVIYVSCPPAVGLIIGMLLKRVTNRPLVVDYRDLWTGNPFTSYPTRFHYDLEKRIEERVLRNCDAIITISRCQKEELLRAFPFLEGTDIEVVTNGYDPEDFLSLKLHKYEKLTVVHTGTIYGARASHLDVFLKALNHLLRSEKVSDFQIVFVGSSPPDVERNLTNLLQELDLSARVVSLGKKSHRETLQRTLGADVLLLIPGSPKVVTTKIFEYLAAGKFIFNVSEPNSETAQIIDEAKAGITVKPDIASIQESLHRILSLKEYKVKKDKKVVSKFSRIELTKKLASIFDQVSKY